MDEEDDDFVVEFKKCFRCHGKFLNPEWCPASSRGYDLLCDTTSNSHIEDKKHIRPFSTWATASCCQVVLLNPNYLELKSGILGSVCI